MRIHSDTLTPADIRQAVADIDGVWVDHVTTHRSNKRARGFEVRLAASPGLGRRRRNTGQWGAEGGSVAAATWDEHGRWMVGLFAVDPAAIVGPYDGVADFHRQTRDAFAA